MARAYWRLNAQVGSSVKDTGALTTPLTSVISGSYHWSVVRTLLHVIQHHNQLRDTSSQTAYGSGSERALKEHTNVYTLSDHYILSSYCTCRASGQPSRAQSMHTWPLAIFSHLSPLSPLKFWVQRLGGNAASVMCSLGPHLMQDFILCSYICVCLCCPCSVWLSQ